MILLGIALLLIFRVVALYVFNISLTVIDYALLLVTGVIAFRMSSMLVAFPDPVTVDCPPLPQGARPGYVYLLQGQKGYYKIGRTVDPNDRYRTFKLKLPFDVDYLHLIPCRNRFAAEGRLHRCFDHRRVTGSEWFRLSLDDVALIKSIKEM